jgi:hypothetical protein
MPECGIDKSASDIVVYLPDNLLHWHYSLVLMFGLALDSIALLPQVASPKVNACVLYSAGDERNADARALVERVQPDDADNNRGVKEDVKRFHSQMSFYG